MKIKLKCSYLAIFNWRVLSALKNTGFEDALKELGLSEGSGSDGFLPSGGSRQGSYGAACNNILNDWRSFNSSADRAVPG